MTSRLQRLDLLCEVWDQMDDYSLILVKYCESLNKLIGHGIYKLSDDEWFDQLYDQTDRCFRVIDKMSFQLSKIPFD